MNGSIGIVEHIRCKPGDEVGQPGANVYVVVRFEASCLKQTTVKHSQDSKSIPIYLTKSFCEKQCCYTTQVPLRVCKALTCHKVQGMSVGEGEIFEKGVLYLPDGKLRNTPGLMLTAFTRFKKECDYAIGTPSTEIDTTYLMKIGTTQPYEERRTFRNYLSGLSERNMQRSKEAIAKLHQCENGNEKTFEGGCDFLLEWYRSTFGYGNETSSDVTG